MTGPSPSSIPQAVAIQLADIEKGGRSPPSNDSDDTLPMLPLSKYNLTVSDGIDKKAHANTFSCSETNLPADSCEKSHEMTIPKEFNEEMIIQLTTIESFYGACYLLVNAVNYAICLDDSLVIHTTRIWCLQRTGRPTKSHCISSTEARGEYFVQQRVRLHDGQFRAQHLLRSFVVSDSMSMVVGRHRPSI